jgi:hypothetical protein
VVPAGFLFAVEAVPWYIFKRISFQKRGHLEMLEEKIRELYRITAELEEKYPGRRFTPDGHLVGSIGEVYAAEKYGLTLLEASSEKHDARSADGRLIQIKITQTDRVSIYSEPDYLIVMKMKNDGTIEEVYNGKGSAPWENAGKVQKNGQRSINLKKLVSLNAVISSEDRIRKKTKESE